MNKVTLNLILLIFLKLSACNENPLNDGNKLQPGRRDYTWTVDTLNIPFTTLQRIWGSSPTDVWAIGPGGDADKTIYHFDGVKWETDGISRPLAPTAIFGFASDNIWIGGNGGFFWYYDGQNWNEHNQLTIENYPNISIENILGDSPHNIYAVGFAENSQTYKSVIAHFDGFYWQAIESSVLRNSFLKIQRGVKTSNNYFILGIRLEQFFEDTSYIYEFDGLKVTEIYKGLANSNEIGGIEIINGEMYFLKGHEMFKYVNNNFQLFLKIDEPSVIWGRNSKDILIGKLNGIEHYNGTDIQYLYQFDNPGIRIFTAIIFEKETFVLTYDFNNSLNLVLRGKLN